MPDDFITVGVLLAAGRGRRFDAGGRANKLLAKLPDGRSVVTVAAAQLRAIVPTVIAPVRYDAPEVTHLLNAGGCEVLPCPCADDGMGSVLAFAMRHLQAMHVRASACLIALGDMPFIRQESIAAVAAALANHAVVVPTFAGAPGHPVGFRKEFFDRLAALSGDSGARRFIATTPGVCQLELTDPGIVRDVDVPRDLFA